MDVGINVNATHSAWVIAYLSSAAFLPDLVAALASSSCANLGDYTTSTPMATQVVVTASPTPPPSSSSISSPPQPRSPPNPPGTAQSPKCPSPQPTSPPTSNYSTSSPPPSTLSARTTVEIEMNMGWTWMSLNVEDDDMSTTAVFASIDSQLVANDYLKSQTSFSQYYPGFGFYGTLSALDTAQMYKVQMANGVTLTFSGTPTPLPKTVIFVEGWNYMPCPFQTTTGLDIGQPSLAYTQDDQIKSQTVFATYYDGYGWFGNLNDLYPGAGYKMKLATGGDAIFPDLSSGRRQLEPSLLQYRKPSVTHWTVNSIDGYKLKVASGGTSTFAVGRRQLAESAPRVQLASPELESTPPPEWHFDSSSVSPEPLALHLPCSHPTSNPTQYEATHMQTNARLLSLTSEATRE